MKHLALLSSILCAGLAAGQTLNCDLAARKTSGACVIRRASATSNAAGCQDDHGSAPA